MFIDIFKAKKRIGWCTALHNKFMNISKKITCILRTYGFPALTGGVLSLCYSPLEWSFLVWVAFIPLLFSLTVNDGTSAVRKGFAAGLAFWMPTIFWLTKVTFIGWFTLCCYCALYVVPFSWLAARVVGKKGTFITNIGAMALLTLVWTGSEYIRSVFLTGFGWNPLGLALHGRLYLLQLCSLGGVLLLSSLIMWVNVGIFFTLQRWGGGIRQRFHPELMVVLLVLVASHGTGKRLFEASCSRPMTETLDIAMVQPNIPQDRKWFDSASSLEQYEAYCSFIYQRLTTLSQTAIHMPEVQLVVWPETALPDDVRLSPASYNVVRSVVTNGVELLLGSMDTEWQARDKGRFFNSAFLFDTNANIKRYYDKQHLVLFGEYAPFTERFPFLKAISPLSENFSPGTNTVIFDVDQTPFSVLICFEDTVEKLARQDVDSGARMLFNLTNDAWFDVSSGSRQHMFHLVLRCVENGVPAARCANTGITCTIDAQGRIQRILRNGDQTTCTSGVLAAQMQTTATYRTFYQRWGYWFGPLTGVFAICAVTGWFFASKRTVGH